MAQIRYAKIRMISLLPRGATQLPVLYKGEAMATLEDLGLQSVLTKGAEEGLLTAVVWPAGNKDDTGLEASRKVCQQMAHDAMIDGVGIDMNHDGKMLTKEQACVVESFLIQAGDPRFTDLTDYSGNPVDAEGAWGTVIKIQDPEIRRLYREGEWNAVSMMGPALVSKAQAATPSIEDITMTPEQFSAMTDLIKAQAKSIEDLQKVNTERADLEKAELVKAEAEAKAKADAEAETLIKFEGDPTKAKDVQAHLAKVKLSQVDFTDAEAVSAHLATLTVVKKAESTDGDSEELTLAKEQLVKAEAALLKAECGTNQNPDDESDENEDIDVLGLRKSESEAWKLGSRMAKFCNQPLTK